MNNDFKKADALKPGDLISIVAPAYPLREDMVEKTTKKLQAMGYRVRHSENVFKRRGYLAGEDEERAFCFMKAWCDPEVKAVLPGSGGYGVTRILNLMDWDRIAQYRRILMGFSDITALHLAIQKKLHLMTFHGPNVVYALGAKSEMHPMASHYFYRSIFAEGYYDVKGNKIQDGWIYDFSEVIKKPEVLNPGTGQGRITGGNLALVSALMGTPWEIETEDRILFLEDIDEAPYRVDRMLSQLRMGGKLKSPAGVILGGFRKCVAEKPEKSLNTEQVFLDYFKGCSYPVIKNFPAGHIKANATLPMGAMAEIRAQEAVPCIRIMENPVSLNTRS